MTSAVVESSYITQNLLRKKRTKIRVFEGRGTLPAPHMLSLELAHFRKKTGQVRVGLVHEGFRKLQLNQPISKTIRDTLIKPKIVERVN